MSGILPLKQLAMEEVSWYWFPRIPFGAITLVFGRAGIGKSTMVYDMLARASIGEAMPNAAERPKPPADIENMRSIIIGTEDTPERVASVLDRAGADLDQIGIIPQDNLPDPTLSPLQQMEFVAEETKKFGAAVLYVDNVSEALLGNTDSNNERSVRYALRPLDTLAKHLGISVLMTTHPRKNVGAGPVVEGITGSQAFTNLARSVLYVDRVPGSDQMGVGVAKSNYYPADRVNTLAFKVNSEKVGEQDGHDLLSIPWLDWRGVVPYTAQGMATENARLEAERAKEAGYEA